MNPVRVNPNVMMIGMQDVYSTMLEQTAQNLANANTIGFKAFRTKIKDSEVAIKPNGTKVKGVAVENIQRSYSSGSLSVTSNPNDMAITGFGLFGVQTPEGIRYTRNGQFHRDDNGFMVDSNGNFLLDADQTPIQLPLNATLYVSAKGVMTVNGKTHGTLGVFYFEEIQKLKPMGFNLMEAEEEPIQSENFSLTQGAVEESNVSTMKEAINLINIQRTFEYSQKLLDEYYQQQKKINQVNARNV